MTAAALYSPSLKASAYKRETPLAGQYHNCDFDWAQLAAEVAPIVARQEEVGRAALETAAAATAAVALAPPVELPPPEPSATAAQASTASPTTPAASTGQGSHLGSPEQHELQSLAALPEEDWCAAHAAASTSSVTMIPGLNNYCGGSSQRRRRSQQQQQQQRWQQESASQSEQGGKLAANALYEGGKWDEFYASTARSVQFFRERRYLLKEFPMLADEIHTQHVCELGCGSGASLMPVMRSRPVRVTATDISPTSLMQLRTLAETLEGSIPGTTQRLTTFVADSADPAAEPQFRGLQADVALVMFTLSAVPPSGQAHMLANAYASLRPGGFLCIRDHGLYDMVQLRIPPQQWAGPNLYKRGDGTLAYFFSVEDMQAKGGAAGFHVVDCEYVTVYNTNRKTGLQLRRVFVHAVLQKLC